MQWKLDIGGYSRYRAYLEAELHMRKKSADYGWFYYDSIMLQSASVSLWVTGRISQNKKKSFGYLVNQTIKF